MCSKLAFGLVMSGVMVASSAISADVNKQTVLVKGRDVTAQAPSDAALGKFYVIQFQIPNVPAGQDVETALLEFYVDAASFPKEVHFFPGTDSAYTATHSNSAPVLEVAALTGALGGDLDPSLLDPELRRVKRIPLGSSRRVLIDLTAFVRSFLAEPAKNRGLVIGSLSGMRDGDFTLLSGVLPDDAVARIRVYFAPRR